MSACVNLTRMPQSASTSAPRPLSTARLHAGPYSFYMIAPGLRNWFSKVFLVSAGFMCRMREPGEIVLNDRNPACWRTRRMGSAVRVRTDVSMGRRQSRKAWSGLEKDSWRTAQTKVDMRDSGLLGRVFQLPGSGVTIYPARHRQACRRPGVCCGGADCCAAAAVFLRPGVSCGCLCRTRAARRRGA